ncbi:MAG: hypothetical protein RIK87_05420, partial [Fuerstiella sp.]
PTTRPTVVVGYPDPTTRPTVVDGSPDPTTRPTEGLPVRTTTRARSPNYDLMPAIGRSDATHLLRLEAPATATTAAAPNHLVDYSPSPAARCGRVS